MLIQTLISSLVALLFPKAPSWVGSFLTALVPAIIDLVEELQDHDEMDGSQKRKFVIHEVAELLDDTFDDIPHWADLEEEKRDRILGGLTELALFIDRSYKEKRLPKLSIMRSLRKLRR